MTKQRTAPRMAAPHMQPARQPATLEQITETDSELGSLVLSRHKNEAIWLGRDIRITVVDISKGKVRLHISAPRSLPIVRTELVSK